MGASIDTGASFTFSFDSRHLPRNAACPSFRNDAAVKNDPRIAARKNTTFRSSAASETISFEKNPLNGGTPEIDAAVTR